MDDLDSADLYREIDPAVFAPPSPQELREAASREIARTVADLYHASYGDAPFTVVTMMAAAAENAELRNALLIIAPDRFGIGSLSRNMLTRWFTAQETAMVPGARFRVCRVGAAIWRYVPVADAA
jgi:hypothetical protein